MIMSGRTLSARADEKLITLPMGFEVHKIWSAGMSIENKYWNNNKTGVSRKSAIKE